MLFSLKLVELLYDKDRAQDVAKGLLYDYNIWLVINLKII